MSCFCGASWAANMLNQVLRCFNPYRLADSVERTEEKLQFKGVGEGECGF